jgi:hypothetical protein
MAEILTWKFNYLPIDNQWTVINCEKREEILNYLRPQSIILISQKEFYKKNNYLFFNLINLAFSQSSIIFIDGLENKELNEEINNLIRRKFEPNDKVDIIKKTYQNLKKFFEK